MEKKTWNAPEFLELGVESTECLTIWNWGSKPKKDYNWCNNKKDHWNCQS